MSIIEEKFAALATEHAPGQEVRQVAGDIGNLQRGDLLVGVPVDFSHGDVDAFTPTPGAFETFTDAVAAGGQQAYTEYRGSAAIRADLAGKLADFTGAPVSAEDGLILTPGTQGALFLAVAATVAAGDRVAIIQPDYFANRKLVQFFGGEIVPVQIHYMTSEGAAGLDLGQLRDAFISGARLFLFSNPNNPTGVVYAPAEIQAIARLAAEFDATVIVDQLYSRLRYEGVCYSHLRAAGLAEDRVVTIMGPSKTESLSGYRLGVAFGAQAVIERMEKLQAIVSLRAAGYNQAVLRTWFSEPTGWLDERIRLHQAIRNELIEIFRAGGLQVRIPQAGSYLFPEVPPLDVGITDFVRLLRMQAGVTVTPGPEFGPHWSSMRLNFSQDHAAATAAGRRIIEMVRRYRR
ncbi:MAG: pyridoxal phosphate-dependent aminotransferase [Ferrovibrio sp.]|uniref:pyridoxal phosphate-dependent aminotransferase n=1 Tax=Ferrovibrio sp. TaxID=1917215 RepID=UPI00260812AC|nr:pyridoxal phosphate-dependent aminotransferase [Ferrovibrio sp.]MCW0234277.1 pyridoxal phosphate-dependent aminotransferase [Ferrovibrio sp.]